MFCLNFPFPANFTVFAAIFRFSSGYGQPWSYYEMLYETSSHDQNPDPATISKTENTV
jgi:hypothetical protein